MDRNEIMQIIRPMAMYDLEYAIKTNIYALRYAPTPEKALIFEERKEEIRAFVESLQPYCVEADAIIESLQPSVDAKHHNALVFVVLNTIYRCDIYEEDRFSVLQSVLCSKSDYRRATETYSSHLNNDELQEWMGYFHQVYEQRLEYLKKEIMRNAGNRVFKSPYLINRCVLRDKEFDNAFMWAVYFDLDRCGAIEHHRDWTFSIT